MKKIFIILFAAIAVAMWAAQPIENDHTTLLNKHLQENPDRPAKDIDEEDPYFILTGEADSAIARQDYYVAIMRLRDAMAVEPDNPGNVLLLSNLGMIYSYLDQDSMALQAYNEALEKAPSMSTVLCNRALLRLKMGQDVEAWRDFSAVIDRDSLNATARYYHGIISLYGGDRQGAEEDFMVLEQIDPDSDHALVAMSSLYSLTGQSRKAIPYYEKLIERDPAAEYYSALAGCYLDLENYTEASHVIGEGLRTCGDDPELYYYRAWLNKANYLLDDAHADAKRAIDLGADPRRVNALFEK